MKCLIENCPRKADTRGLCKVCYTSAGKNITKGIVHSWEFLEDLGMALPLSKRSPPPRAPFSIELARKMKEAAAKKHG